MSEIEIRKPVNKLARFNLLLIILLFVSLGAIGYYGIYFWQDLNSKINRLNQANKIILAENNKNTNNLDKRIDTLQSGLKLMSSSKIEVYQISELVALANQVLVVYGDINGTLRLLGFVEAQLSINNNPTFDPLKKALGHDIETLSRANNIDRVVLSGKIDSLSDVVLGLHLEEKLNSQTALINTTDTKLHKFLLNIQNTIAGVVNISKTNQKEILLPTNEDIAKENIRFDLLNAKLALLDHNQKSWSYNLQNASSDLNTYFYEYVGFKDIESKITELIKIDVSTDRVNIDDTVNAMNKIKSQE